MSTYPHEVNRLETNMSENNMVVTILSDSATSWESCKRCYPIGCRLYMDVVLNTNWTTHLEVGGFENSVVAVMIDGGDRKPGDELYVVVEGYREIERQLQLRVALHAAPHK